MSEPKEPKESDKNFLERWSRRKRDAERERAAVNEASAPTAETPRPGEPAVAAPEPVFDIKSLPPIESIGPTTDIRAFLKPGVPAALTREALRRVWIADPAIRNYIGPSENAWDFNDPTAMAGFGPLAPGEAERLLASLFPEPSEALPEAGSTTEQTREVAENPNASPEPAVAAPAEETVIADHASGEVTTDDVASKHLAEAEPANAAPQQQEPAQPRVFAHLRRGHGGALPE